MNFWVARGGQQQGPLSIADVQRMLAQGQLSPTDLAWREGMPQWLPISQVIPAPQPTPAPPAPAPAPPPPAAAPPMGGPQYGYPPQQQQYAPPQANPMQPPMGQPGPYGYTPQQPGMQPGMMQPGMMQPGMMAQPMAGAPVPPNLHWALVLLFAILTMGIFSWVWIFIEASFVKKIDPRSNAKVLMMVVILVQFAFIGLLVVGLAGGAHPSDMAILFSIAPIANIVTVVCAIVAWFSMRTSLVQYYNYTEPIGLRLSGAMTFFFNMLYFQHHFSRIAEWKRTGILTPQ